MAVIGAGRSVIQQQERFMLGTQAVDSLENVYEEGRRDLLDLLCFAGLNL